MGQYVFILPDVGEGTAEAEIVAWHVQVGDHVKQDAPLVDVMTDKATVEMTSPVAGRVVSTHGEPGEMMPVGGPLVVFETEAEEGAGVPAPALAPVAPPVPAPAAAGPREPAPAPARPAAEPEPPRAPAHAASAPTAPAARPPAPARAPALHVVPPEPARAAERREPALKEWSPSQASPAVRARAQRLGLDLGHLRGSGPEGRITHEDLDAVLVRAANLRRGAPARAERSGVESVKVIGLRRRIAEKMQEAKRRIPHFAYVEECDLTELEELRAHLNATRRADQPKLTLLPFLMRALVQALPEFPQINARFDDDQGVVDRHAAVDLGIATQTEQGLLVPVVRHAEARDLWECAAEVARLAAAVRENRASKEELSGSTLTITSLGALGGIVTTPVINHPEVAIVGVNRMAERPVVRGGAIVVRKMMNLSSSFDHRVVDGYDAAAFIQRVKGLLEHPAALFLER